MKYKVRNLVTAISLGEVDVIAHQANCFCRMKSGVAADIVRYFPEAEAVDNRTIAGDKNKLGMFTFATLKYPLSSRYVFNLYGQYKYGRDEQHTDYATLESALIGMRHALLSLFPKSLPAIGFPKIGSGLGGGDWSVISNMIERVFADFDVTIYVLSEEDIPSDDNLQERDSDS